MKYDPRNYREMSRFQSLVAAKVDQGLIGRGKAVRMVQELAATEKGQTWIKKRLGARAAKLGRSKSFSGERQSLAIACELAKLSQTDTQKSNRT
ncbi:MAG: hypothetical protein ACE5FH_10225 [Candidatus Zixiibacteriota bacterium]